MAVALGRVVVGAVGREHQQVVAAGRDRGAGLEQRARRAVDHLSLHTGHREQSDIFQREQTVGRGAEFDRRLMDGDPLCQRQRLVRHREEPTVAPPPDPLKPGQPHQRQIDSRPSSSAGTNQLNSLAQNRYTRVEPSAGVHTHS